MALGCVGGLGEAEQSGGKGAKEEGDGWLSVIVIVFLLLQRETIVINLSGTTIIALP